MPERKSVFVFDGDETLYLSNWQYDQAYLKFFGYLHEIFPAMVPSLHPLYRKFFEEIEQDNTEHHGVRKQRILQSMLDAYEAVCLHIESDFGINPRRKEHERRIREIAIMPFDFQRVIWLPNAKRTLNYLLSKNHKICLLSSYDNSTFPHKKKFLELHHFFKPENIYTTEIAKTKEDFIKVSGWTKAAENEFDKWYTVGNGTSDIKPALEISERWRGLYVRRASTSPFFENTTSDFVPSPMNAPRVIDMTRIVEVLEYMQSKSA